MEREPIMQFFKFDHLPADKQATSRPFGELAEHIHATLPRNPERSVALRKLLEAKDAAVRAGFMVLLALLVCLPVPALANVPMPPDVPGVRVASAATLPSVVTSAAVGQAPEAPAEVKPSPALQLGAALQDLLFTALLAGLAFLANFLRQKTAESKAARVGLVVTESARAAVLELDASMKPKLKAYLADGVLSEEEKADLKKTALELLKSKLPGNLLTAAGGIFGAFTDTYLAGKIEQAVAEKNALQATAEKVAASPQ